MPQEIVSQSDYYGLPQPERAPAPAPERVADLLKAPTPWSGPTKIAGFNIWQPEYNVWQNEDALWDHDPVEDDGRPNHEGCDDGGDPRPPSQRRGPWLITPRQPGGAK